MTAVLRLGDHTSPDTINADSAGKARPSAEVKNQPREACSPPVEAQAQCPRPSQEP